MWVYLPPDYEDSKKEYPVLIMHDGQNLFDASHSFSGEWKVDEHLNKLHLEGHRIPIVIGVENGQWDRGNEYMFIRNDSMKMGGQGEAYLNSLIDDLLPAVEKKYRISKKREDRGIMGSSLGGVISVYALAEHSDSFALYGIFSPALIWAVCPSKTRRWGALKRSVRANCLSARIKKSI